MVKEYEVLIIIEEGVIGGFGVYVLYFMVYWGLLDKGCVVWFMVMKDFFID